MLTEEQKIKNFNLFIKKLNDCNVDTSNLVFSLSNEITNASYSISNEFGSAYDGSLLNVILRILTPYAIKLNDLLPEDIKLPQNKVVKVCLLHQLSKCQMFAPNDNQWEVEKLGRVYKYTPFDYALKMGMRSLVLAQEHGITFSIDEIEALTVFDRDPCDEQVKFHSCVLSTIIRQAMELTIIQLKKNKQ